MRRFFRITAAACAVAAVLAGGALGAEKWQGVDEAVVEKIAHEHGRQAHRPLLDPGEGDILLFAFTAAGAAGGFAAGYWWRALSDRRGGNPEEK